MSQLGRGIWWILHGDQEESGWELGSYCGDTVYFVFFKEYICGLICNCMQDIISRAHSPGKRARDDRVYCIQNLQLKDYLMSYPITYLYLKITGRGNT